MDETDGNLKKTSMSILRRQEWGSTISDHFSLCLHAITQPAIPPLTPEALRNTAQNHSLFLSCPSKHHTQETCREVGSTNQPDIRKTAPELSSSQNKKYFPSDPYPVS